MATQAFFVASQDADMQNSEIFEQPLEKKKKKKIPGWFFVIHVVILTKLFLLML